MLLVDFQLILCFSPSQKELVEHYTAIAASTCLPVLLYNNPPKTGVNLAAAPVAQLADVPNIVGIKDSSGDFTLMAEYIRLTRGKDFHVLLGGTPSSMPACVTAAKAP